MATYNLIGGKQQVDYKGMQIAHETAKAVLLEGCSVSIWLPKKVFIRQQQHEVICINIVLPFFFNLQIKQL